MQQVLDALKTRSSEKTRATYIRHGNPPDRTLGVSIADLKAAAKTIRGQQDMAYQLYETGLLEPMYLAGLVATGAKMDSGRLQAWAESTEGMDMISDYTVPWVTIENPSGSELAMRWIGSDEEHMAAAGWCTYSGLLAVTPDTALNFGEIKSLLALIPNEIHGAKNRVRSTMNRFVIAVGNYVVPLLTEAKAAADKIGVVHVDVGNTDCKISVATAAIAKAEAAGKIGQKRKSIRC